MTRSERRQFRRTFLVGCCLSLAVWLMAYVNGWQSLERWAYDQRARHFQFFAPQPTDTLVHLDIDDRSLDAIGAWPWDRTVLARIIDQLHDAGAAVIGMDILLPEPQVRSLALPDGSVHRVDLDESLAAAMRRSGRVLIPLSLDFTPDQPVTAMDLDFRQWLSADLELSLQQIQQRWQQQHPGQVADAREMENQFLAARRVAMLERIEAQLAEDTDPPDLSHFQTRLLPQTPASLSDSPLLRLLANRYQVALSLHHLRRFSLPVPATWNDPAGDVDPLAVGVEQNVPIPAFCLAAQGAGVVDFAPDSDGKLRQIPLFIRHRDRLYPQLGLALAARKLDLDLARTRIEPDQVVLFSRSGEKLLLPVRSAYVSEADSRFALFMNLSWFGPAQRWEHMYDKPAQRRSVAHLPITAAWEMDRLHERVLTNLRSADDALRHLLGKLDAARLRSYQPPPLAPEGYAPRAALIGPLLAEIEQLGYLKALDEIPPQQQTEEGRQFLAACEALKQIQLHTPGLIAEHAQALANLRSAVQGKAVLIGWTATGAAADFVPTSLHARCPGVVVHGVVYNAILTGHLWRALPAWIAGLILLTLGLLTTLATAAWSPFKALLVALSLALGYLLFNGLWLFDYANLILDLASPLLAIGLVWIGCTAFRIGIERAERARITARFRHYVDPALVNYVVENPELAQLRGQVRTMTVAFTDLQGFTRLTEQLREQTVPLLNQYLERMVPLIRSQGGYVNKFLGDGIMFFYGAPLPDPDHCAHAAASLLQMQAELRDFNQKLRQRGLPLLQMRAGFCAGAMVVGDAGSSHACDYTVLGDRVNLASRLESANKMLGTDILLNEEAALLIRDDYLCCPVGRLQVVGKSEGVMTYQLLAPRSQAGEAHLRLVHWRELVLQAYHQGDFLLCLRRLKEMQTHLGSAPWTQLLDHCCRTYQAPPPPDFSGLIPLAQK